MGDINEKDQELLNDRDQAILMKILDKPANELTKNDIGILRARVSYLTKAEKKQYAKALKVKTVKSEEKKSKTNKDDKKKPDVQVDPELQKILDDAKELGIDTEGMEAKEIEKAINVELEKN